MQFTAALRYIRANKHSLPKLVGLVAARVSSIWLPSACAQGRKAEVERLRLISAGFSANQTQDVTFRDVRTLLLSAYLYCTRELDRLLSGAYMERVSRQS